MAAGQGWGVFHCFTFAETGTQMVNDMGEVSVARKP